MRRCTMRLHLDFEPCSECAALIAGLAGPAALLLDEKDRRDGSVRFLRHLTYNHPEVIHGVTGDLPRQKGNRDYDFFR